jgi:hypothetical protein
VNKKYCLSGHYSPDNNLLFIIVNVTIKIRSRIYFERLRILTAFNLILSKWIGTHLFNYKSIGVITAGGHTVQLEQAVHISIFFKSTGGFPHIYANDKAMQGYASGYFPQGSIFVFDVIDGVEADA